MMASNASDLKDSILSNVSPPLEASRPPEPIVEEGAAIGAEETWPYYAEDEIAAAISVLQSGRVNQWTGSTVTEFQDECSRVLGVDPGIALANGSVALELPLRAFGIGEGDEVVVTPRTFVASAFCVRLVGAEPVFADVDPQSGNITAKSIEAVLTERTKAIIPVHLAGWPCEMPAIMELARRYGLRVIEDCAQAHGAKIDGKPVGSFGDAAAFSFCQDKIISTGGEGGFTSFKHPQEYEWAWSFKDHGKNRSKITSPSTSDGSFRWLHDMVGTNWRLTAPQAAIGIRQLAKLRQWNTARKKNAQVWRDQLECVPGVEVPTPHASSDHAYYKLYAYLDVPDPEAARREIIRQAGEAGIRVFSGSCSEVYLEEAFADLTQPELPVARKLGKTSLMFEVHPTLKEDLLQVRAARVAEIIHKVLS